MQRRESWWTNGRCKLSGIPTNVLVHCSCHPTQNISEREREKEYTRKPLLSATTWKSNLWYSLKWHGIICHSFSVQLLFTAEIHIRHLQKHGFLLCVYIQLFWHQFSLQWKLSFVEISYVKGKFCYLLYITKRTTTCCKESLELHCNSL